MWDFVTRKDCKTRSQARRTKCVTAKSVLTPGRCPTRHDPHPDAQHDCEAALDHLAWLIGEQTRKGAPENPQYLSLLGQVLARQSQIHFLQGRSPEGRKTHAEAVEKLSRAIELDPARAADKVRLEQIKAGPAQSEK